MLRKKTAMLLLTVVYAILLGHNIFPHYHYDTDHDLLEHHQTNHHHDNDEEGLNNLFSYLLHSSDGFTPANNDNITNTFFKQLFSIVAILSDNCSFDKFLILPLLYSPPAEHFNNLSFNACTFGLRAPPTFIA